MIEFFKKHIGKEETLADKRKRFLETVINDPNHSWINEDRLIKRAIKILVESLKENHIDFFFKHPTFFIPCQAQLSCAIGSTKNHHLILVFPELIQILRSASLHHGVAILAHELGHIFYQHTEQKIDTLKAQIEADDFAFQIGFGEELQEVLLDHVNSIDCRVRISRLTSKLLTQ